MLQNKRRILLCTNMNITAIAVAIITATPVATNTTTVI
jgi:hypothetical protein